MARIYKTGAFQMKQEILIKNLGYVLENWWNYKNHWEMIVILNRHEQISYGLLK